MYAPDRFMELAQDYLKQSVRQSAIEELKEVEKQKAEVPAPSPYVFNIPLDPEIEKALRSGSLVKAIEDLRFGFAPSFEKLRIALEGFTPELLARILRAPLVEPPPSAKPIEPLSSSEEGSKGGS